MTARQAVEALEPVLPDGDDERFIGYGVMGMPFASGHYLALRDFVATSVGPAYRAIWHRDPDGHWTIHTTGSPELTCPRYFSSVARAIQVPRIEVSWPRDNTLVVKLDDELSWRIELRATPATRTMTCMGGLLPEAGWNSAAVLGAMGRMSRPMLRTGRIRLSGSTPNGPVFKAAPLQVWRVIGSSATYDGVDLGDPDPFDEQTRLGDFWLPQRGVFFVGRARFTRLAEPDPGTVGTGRARMER